jgi:hypothetical protein
MQAFLPEVYHLIHFFLKILKFILSKFLIHLKDFIDYICKTVTCKIYQYKKKD